MRLLWIFTFLAILLLVKAEITQKPYKILVLGPIGSRSLYYLTKSLSEALGDAGHSATLVSTFKPSSKHPNVTEVPTGASPTLLEEPNVFELQAISSAFEWVAEATTTIATQMWSNTNIKDLWLKRNDFDAIVIIGYGNEIAAPFLMDFQGVYINLCTPGIEFIHLAQMGNRLPLSVTPSFFLPYDENMNFLERALNPLTMILHLILYYYKTVPAIQEVMWEIFPEKPPLLQLYENSRLTLINGHFALDGPAPLLPNQVEIGTINAKEPKPLPQDLEEFVTTSGNEGVIYFSLGSIVKSTDIPKKYKDMFLEAFKRLPQKVIWKYEGDDLNLPSNVITRKWLPQQDILGHPKTRLFISHCGNLGTQEAKYHGVPVLAVPVAFDQPRNAARMARKGYGLVLNWDDMTSESIYNAIQTLLQDPSYASRLKLVSEVLKDQKETPGERAVWWIEYVIRHKDHAAILAYAGKKLNFLQYIMVDVFAFWIAVLSLWILLSYCFCIKMYRLCCGSKGKAVTKKKLS